MRRGDYDTKITCHKNRNCQNGRSGQQAFFEPRCSTSAKTAWRNRWIDQIGLSSDWGANWVGVLCPSQESLRRRMCLYSWRCRNSALWRYGFKGLRRWFYCLSGWGKAHDLRNTGSNILKCIIVGQRPDFDIVYYPEQTRRLCCANGEKGDLVDIAMIVFRQ